MMIRILSICVLTAALSACASLNPEQRLAECKATNWQQYGVNDGRLGVPTSDRSGVFDDCAELGQPVDVVAYQAGRMEGLTAYCTLENGYTVGYEGRRYHKVCPPTLEPDFLQGFERGRKERPALAVSPSIGIGVGSGGGVRIGVGVGLFNYYRPHRRKRYGFGYPRYHFGYGYRHW